VLLGVATTFLLGAVLAARPADPAAADPPRQAARQRFVAERAATAAQALDALQAALGPAREAARRGAALVQVGDEPPAPALQEAADLLEGGADEAQDAAAALDTLRGVAGSARAGVDIPQVPDSAELRGIAGQLRQAADIAGPFIDRRHAAEQTLLRLEDALVALEAGDARSALAALDDARRSRRQLARWDPAPVTLPLWLSTTDRMVSAAEAIAQAVLDDDREAAQRAAEEYADAAADARRADVSLALSLSESGAGLTETPLRRLGNALAAIEQTEAVVASLMQADP
jgi:hypothetical protein